MSTEEQKANKFVKLERVYLKDLSFKSPRGPVYPPKGASPKTELNIKSSSNKIESNRFEVLLTLTIRAVHDDDTIFIVELTQAGSFEIVGYDQEELGAILGAFAVSQIYPFARESVSHMITSGGFPPLLLQPINFDALYMRSLSSQGNAEENIKVH
jgi:preprotein translocase subunit SecB